MKLTRHGDEYHAIDPSEAALALLRTFPAPGARTLGKRRAWARQLPDGSWVCSPAAASHVAAAMRGSA